MRTDGQTVAFRYFAKVSNLTHDTRLNIVGEAGGRITSLPVEPSLRSSLKDTYTTELRTSVLASKQMMI